MLNTVRTPSSFLAWPTKPMDPKSETYLDLVGTGGDSTFSFNISTTSAFVAAGAGLHIAKHLAPLQFFP